MRESRIVKKFIAILLIVAIMLPYSSEVLAVALTQNDTTVMLETSIEHEGGDEASGQLPEEYEADYDYHPYSYQIANSGSEGRTTVFKIIKEGDYSFEDALFCLNAEKSFPSAGAKEYKNIGDLKAETTTAASSLINSIGAQNYKSLVWLIDNMYLRKQQPQEKMEFISKAFAKTIADNVNTIPPVTAEYIASVITDDDIEVVEQWAIWYFTNGNKEGYSADYEKYYNAKYSTFGTVYVSGMSTNGEYVTLSDLTGNGARQELLNVLYAYLVDSAKAATTAEAVTYPSFAMQNTDLSCTVEGDFYKVGPFNVTAGTAMSSSYSIKLVDIDGLEIDRAKYQIKIDGEDEFTASNVNEIFGKNYYIYLPIEGNTVSKVKINIDYSSYETQASVWSVTSDSTYQPVTLITRGTNLYSDSREKDVETKIFDLALRKYIIKVGNTDISNRIPEVNKDTIETTGTAEYAHKKDAVLVAAGDTVVYEIRVYNEGSLDGTATEITDYLPVGMTLAENSNINTTYGWTVSEDGRVARTEYLKDSNIEAFTSEVDSLYVQIECKIADDLAENITENTILTNVAEITGYSRTDRDSSKTIDASTIDTKTFSGNTSNKEDLSDSEYYYKGLEDDDDFEKVIIEPNNDVFDLALRKFITKINGKNTEVSREPKVDVSKLKDGTSTNATYTHTKTTLEVDKGDIVTYKIRVYNEGDIAGYAEEIADNIPSGLGYLMNYNANIENKWQIPENAQTMKLSEIDNAVKNVKESDFTSDLSLGDEIVVVGGGKFVSKALSSANENNLIEAFDKDNGTTLSYKEVEITCVVLTDTVENNNLKNIAEIKNDLDVNKEEVTDRDSTPDTVDTNNYPGGEGTQDDHDYENLVQDKKFDLSLQKFITGLNSDKVEGREPTITKNDDGTFRYNHTTEPLKVANSDLVTYTIRVYNEGELDGYASEVMDDIPEGLAYLPDNATNKEYGWKMYDKSGKETSDVNQAVSVKTTYLSKEKETADHKTILAAYDSETMQTPAYRDVKVVFQVVENDLTNKTERTIINTAEITDDQDKDGNEVDDNDSTPGNNKSEEDDIDQEKVTVKYFDLALKKSLAKIIITENGKTREIVAQNEDALLKVEINRKYISTTTVKFVYNITVTNQGEIAGYAKELKDHIPEGLKFVAEDNKDWTTVSTNIVKTEALANTLLEPGKSASVPITLEWINSEDNMGEKVNIAEISKDYNEEGSPDIDSTPDNFKSEEDDQDDAPVILSISTGEQPVYVVLSTTVLTILATGIALIKKFVLI